MIALIERRDCYDLHNTETNQWRKGVKPADLLDALLQLGADPDEIAELRRRQRDLLVAGLVECWRTFDRELARRVATRWITEHLVPSDAPHQLSLDGLRSESEHDMGRYVPASHFATAMAKAGIRVDGDQVFAKDRSEL